jgi:hypothetical protein
MKTGRRRSKRMFWYAGDDCAGSGVGRQVEAVNMREAFTLSAGQPVPIEKGSA